MKNIYYYNVNYECNNKCRFCLSTSTYNKKKSINLNDIKNWTNGIYTLKDSRVIINGGEPTIYKDIIEIIELLNSKNAEIVLYSNGRRFSNYKFAEQIIKSGVNRITIPIHGNKLIHDVMTQINGSYNETINALKNISKLKKEYEVELEVKFILTKEIIDNKINLLNLLDNERISLEKLDTIIISGLVESKVSQINNVNLPNEDDLGPYVSNLIDLIVYRGVSINIKIEDVKLCKLNDSIIDNINNNLFIQEKLYENFYFFDSKYIYGHLINYNKKTSFYESCETCGLNEVCGSIMDRYRVLKRNAEGRWSADLE